MKVVARTAHAALPSHAEEELAALIAMHCPQDGAFDPAPSISLYRHSVSFGPLYRASQASFCLIAQGEKEMLIGEERFRYGRSRYLLTTEGLPVMSHITNATRERPYLGVRITLDPALVASVLIDAGKSDQRHGEAVRPLTISGLSEPVLDATLRLLRLLDQPDDCRFLTPLIQREIVYRLLCEGQRARLAQIAGIGGAEQRMSKAIQAIRAGYKKPLSIAQLAESLAMSPSSFHHHFKAATAMSPLQFHKQLRLQEARRLLLGGSCDASEAAYEVGYDDASQFSREYKRLFGAPPIRDIQKMKAVLVRAGVPA